MGAALQATGRNITYSCSWPAYLGDNESTKPWAALIAAGCNLWRNYIDMGPTLGYIQGIIAHFGNFSSVLSEWGPGHDGDMLLLGVEGVPFSAQVSQFAIYCILALPLIMGNDLRKVAAASQTLALNPAAIAINQDGLGRPGVLLGGADASQDETQVWFRPLENGDVAVVLYNYGPQTSHPWHTPCPAFNESVGGYWAPKQFVDWCLPGFGQSLMEWYCCNVSTSPSFSPLLSTVVFPTSHSPPLQHMRARAHTQTQDCAGYNYSAATNTGCLFKDVEGGWVASNDSVGYTKQNFTQPEGGPVDITVNFSDIGFYAGAPVQVYDVLAQSVITTTNASFWVGKGVELWGSHFLRLSQKTVTG